jgi:hypothetical protein
MLELGNTYLHVTSQKALNRNGSVLFRFLVFPSKDTALYVQRHGTAKRGAAARGFDFCAVVSPSYLRVPAYRWDRLDGSELRAGLKHLRQQQKALEELERQRQWSPEALLVRCHAPAVPSRLCPAATI